MAFLPAFLVLFRHLRTPYTLTIHLVSSGQFPLNCISQYQDPGGGTEIEDE